MRPVASIVICTRNRASSLARTLDSLEAAGAEVATEVIVVDNGSVDETAAMVASKTGTFRYPLRLISEPAVGLANARNAGVSVAQGDYILFTDDDVRVHPRWIDELVAGFEPNVAMVTGRVMPRFTNDSPDWLAGGGAQALSLWDYGELPFDMDEKRMPFGASMAVRADLLRAADVPFHPELGHTGVLRTGHEEMYLARQLPGRIRYVPGAVADHIVDDRRADYRFARRAYFQMGFGSARYGRLLGQREPRLSRRIAGVVWIWSKAQAFRMMNRREPNLSPDRAHREFTAYYFAGHHLDQLLLRTPRLADWCARTLV